MLRWGVVGHSPLNIMVSYLHLNIRLPSSQKSYAQMRGGRPQSSQHNGKLPSSKHKRSIISKIWCSDEGRSATVPPNIMVSYLHLIIRLPSSQLLMASYYPQYSMFRPSMKSDARWGVDGHSPLNIIVNLVRFRQSASLRLVTYAQGL